MSTYNTTDDVLRAVSSGSLTVDDARSIINQMLADAKEASKPASLTISAEVRDAVQDWLYANSGKLEKALTRKSGVTKDSTTPDGAVITSPDAPGFEVHLVVKRASTEGATNN
jgi:hypothetical protein